MSLIPTPEQATIIDAARDTTDNLLVSALAGAAKTSTLVMIAHELKKVPILAVCFNKRIQEEMDERLPGNCTAKTLNGLGHRIWSDAIGRRLVVDTKKNFNIIKELIDKFDRADKSAAYDDFAFLLKALEQGKTSGWVPNDKFDTAKRLLDDDEFFNSLEDEPSALVCDLLRAAMFESIKQGYKGTVDFSDQLFLPTVFPCAYPREYKLILVDEAQDLSELNHVMVKKLVKNDRLIAVGDACQSIYAFRGAHQDSMNLLKRTFDMTELTLSVSFRCPELIVREARWRAPHMRWVDWLADRVTGTVRQLHEWDITALPEHTTILCRNNAPLFALAVRILKNGRYAEIVGNDVGRNLVKAMKKFGPLTMPQDAVFAAIRTWREGRLKKSRSPKAVEDQVDCMRIFAEQGPNLGAAIAYAEHLMSARGPITLSTIHKAKGLEWSHVIILDRHLIRKGDQQEGNLLYVAQTRTKDTLWYLNSGDWLDD